MFLMSHQIFQGLELFFVLTFARHYFFHKSIFFNHLCNFAQFVIVKLRFLFPHFTFRPLFMYLHQSPVIAQELLFLALCFPICLYIIVSDLGVHDKINQLIIRSLISRQIFEKSTIAHLHPQGTPHLVASENNGHVPRTQGYLSKDPRYKSRHKRS